MTDRVEDEEGVAPDSLTHFGVLGMKWGVRRGNASRAFARASKKAIRLEKKSVRLGKRGAKLQYKGSKWGSFRKIRKGMRLTYKSTKYAEKARKWELKMAQHLQGVKVSDLQPKHKDAGKQYLHLLRGDEFKVRSVRHSSDDVYDPFFAHGLDETAVDVLASMSVKQKAVLYALVSKATTGDIRHLEEDGPESVSHAEAEDVEVDVDEVFDSFTPVQLEVAYGLIGEALDSEDDVELLSHEDNAVRELGRTYLDHKISDASDDVVTASKLKTANKVVDFLGLSL